MKLAISSGVGLRARGYCFESSVSRGRGGWTNKGGYDLLVVVVVVIVFVSTHSASSMWKLAMSSDLKRRVSDHPVVSPFSGVLKPPRNDFDMVVVGLGSPSWREIEAFLVRVEAVETGWESRGNNDSMPSVGSSASILA